jgi:hypothetical protein
MKKILSSMIALLFITGALHGQGIYMRVGGGYALPMAGETVPKYNQRQNQTGNNNSNIVTGEALSGSYGSGANFNIAGGYMFSKHFGVDLSFQYLLGKKYTSTDNYFYTSDGLTYRETNESESSAKAIFITPSLVITAPLGAHSPYGRFGLIVGKPKVTEDGSYYEDYGDEYTEEYKYEYSKGSAFGFQGTVGMSWGINNTISINTELNFISMAYYAGQREMVKATSDGQDILDDYSVSEKITEFKKEISYENFGEGGQDPEKPSQQLRQGTPFSSIGVQIGLIYHFGGRLVE